jgi:uncharacterized membrane protein
MTGTLHNWWLLAGKLHPLVVHFPIAFLVVGALIEFVRLRRGRSRPAPGAVLCLCVGGVSAVVAATFGWSDAATAGHQGTDAWVLDWHRWLGVLTACFGVITTALALASFFRAKAQGPELGGASTRPRLFGTYRLAAVTAAILVALTGHFGGMLIYGTGYLHDSWTKVWSPLGDNGLQALPVGAAGAPVDFTRDVQPIFARRCYQCHAGEKVESDLHLDSRAGAVKGGKSGHAAIVPGKPAESLLVKLIKGEDPKRAMPPKGGSLEPAQIATLEAWIAQGAAWGNGDAGESWHWAYRPPVRVNPPAVRDPYWARTPIDQFILAKLEQEGLKPSPEADKLTLLRRVSLDLTGLPPTPAEIDAFLADTSPLAYERVVDRLLASPHYGEKMAMKWLDLARYADTHGYEKDQRRTMWPYRDWVIDAFNRDLPFDRFTIDQLAGDLLPDASVDELVATGFNRNTQVNEEGGVDPEEFRIDAVIDRTNTVGTVWLGTTIGCAQCHNHKNDPISQEEYYRFFAYFNNDVNDSKRIDPTEVRAAGGMLPVSTREHRDDLTRVTREIAAAEAELAKAEGAVQAADEGVWEHERALTSVAWAALQVSSATSAGGATLTASEDGSILATGASPETDTYTIEATSDLGRITALRLELIPDDSTPGKGIGRSPHSNIVLTSFSVTALPTGAPARAVAATQAIADFEQYNEDISHLWTVSDSLNGDGKVGWAIKPQEHQAHEAYFRLAHPIESPPGSPNRLRIALGQGFGGKHTIGRLRLSATSDDQPLANAPISQAIKAALSAASADRTPAQRDQLAKYFLSIAPNLAPLRDRLGELRSQRASLIVATAMIMKKADEPRETHVFERGSWLAPGKAVEPGVPSVVFWTDRKTKPHDQPPDRLGLANWLVGGASPLTARVMVNHIWEQHFGRGIVESTEDFGTQGDYPTHPELLDWLATEFIRQGWSMKAMHRLIVTSAAYRQDSTVTKELLERDPYNKLLARAPRLRVDAETVRDIALSAGGLLCEKVGGPSVFPPQPSGIWTMIASNDTWVESKGEDRYRRGLYTFVRRTAPYPSMTAFDSTSREIICTRRPRTDTPLQAMTTLNDPQFVEAAVGVAARMLREGGKTDDERAAYGFLLCVGRQASQPEIERVVQLVHEQRDAFSSGDAAQKLLSDAPGVRHEGLNDRDLACWSIAGNVLLNLDETITRE